MMKKILNKLIRNEEGQALILALILLVVGGLIIAPLMGFMSTGLIVGRVFEERMDELYAADAGVELALWDLIIGGLEVPQGGQSDLPEFTRNNKTVNVTVEDKTAEGGGEPIYLITSTATTDSHSSTTINAYVVGCGGFAFLLDNAITSPSDVIIKPNTEVYGNVQYNGVLDNKGYIDGEIITDEIVDWPTAEQLSAFYRGDVDELTPVPDGYVIDISSGTLADPYPIGPLYAAGDLTITGHGVARLDGTVYVTGNLVVMPNCTILLNGQTIYAEGTIDFQPECIVSGSGCIIAVGFVNYQPNISGDDFVLLLSLEGMVWLKPSNSFCGSVAGNCDVELSPGIIHQWVPPPDGLNLPGTGGNLNRLGLAIHTWEVSLQ